MAIVHTTAIVHDDALQIVRVIVTQCLLLVVALPDRRHILSLIRLLREMAVPGEQDQTLGSHVHCALEEFVVFEVEVGKLVEFASWHILLESVSQAICLFIRAVAYLFYCFGLVVYLVVFNVQ